MKKVEEQNNKIALWVVLTALVCLCFLAFAPQVHAQAASITINDTEANGLTLNLYKIGTFSGNKVVASNDAYKDIVEDLPIDSKTHTDEWIAAAQNLHKAIQKNNIKPDQSKTVSGGKLIFSDLSAGLYLMDGPSVTIGDKVVTPVPTLISVTDNVTVGKVKKTEEPKDTPNKPDDPDNPTPNNPGKPNNPSNPTNPNNPSTPGKTTTTQAKTGDPTEIGIYVALLAVTAAALSYAAVTWQRRRRKDNQT